MKKLLLIFSFAFFLITSSAQEYADFEFTGTNQGTGSFTNTALSDFTWSAIGAIYVMEVLNDEVFDDGNAFENTFGQADNADNLRTQNYPNGEGTIGDTVISISLLTITFDENTPANAWGFCVTDIDVENCLIFAKDINDEIVPPDVIDRWLIELFDCDHVADGLNIPKWDPDNAAILGSDTPETYIEYNNVVMGDMPSSEAAAAFFMPDISLKQLTIRFENLQDIYLTSYHLFIASMRPNGIKNQVDVAVDIYPNPAQDFINIKCPQLANNSAIITIFDLTGKELIEKEIPAGTNNIGIDVSHLKNGVYYSRLISENKSTAQKLIIQK
jgi:hypothetical protein